MPARIKSKSLTVRLEPRLERLLAAHARSRGVSPSEMVGRALAKELEEDIDDPNLFELTKHLVGSVSLTEVRSGRDLRGALSDWNPDRRG
ncbi:MAG: toxin-antitoxin system HicB family antitoxin [Deltaproteobacteria bacterium]|nr:toxin-antitoxin system HicB family antitoxin [Deltaproteobacteria bacterium]